MSAKIIIKKAHQDTFILSTPAAGDTAGNLLWRLLNGETPAANRAPKAAVIMIGTNNLRPGSPATQDSAAVAILR